MFLWPGMMGWGAGAGAGGGSGRGSGGSWQGGGKQMKDIDASLKVWVGNIPHSVEWKELQSHCAKVGKVKWAEIMRKGSGCVAYASAEDAATAIATLNGSLLGGQAIQVDVWGNKEAAAPQAALPVAQATPAPAKAKVAKAPGLVAKGAGDSFADAASLYAGMVSGGKGSGKTGKPVMMPVLTKPISNWAALYEGASQGTATKTKATGGGGAIGGSMKKIDSSKKVWVGNLSGETTWKELEKHFKLAGHTTWVEAKNGLGCVAYKTAEEAQLAIATLNGSELCGSLIQVDAWG